MLSIFTKSSILDLWLGSEYVSGMSNNKCNLKVKDTFSTKEQGKVNTKAKVKSKYYKERVESCKNIQKLIWLNSWNSCAEMFRKIATLKFLGKHAWCRPFLFRCTAYSLERYWRQTTSQIFSCEFFEITHNSTLLVEQLG